MVLGHQFSSKDFQVIVDKVKTSCSISNLGTSVCGKSLSRRLRYLVIFPENQPVRSWECSVNVVFSLHAERQANRIFDQGKQLSSSNLSYLYRLLDPLGPLFNGKRGRFPRAKGAEFCS